MKSLQNTRNPLEISEIEGVSLARAREAVEKADELPGWGRKELQKHIISRRHCMGEWPTEHKNWIEHHRRLFDSGRVEMMTARDGSHFVLYSVPRKTTAKHRRTYFYTEAFV